MKKQRKKWSKEYFIEIANKIHDFKYIYNFSVIKTLKTPTEIMCPKHGNFWQAPNNHIFLKQGCPACYGNKKIIFSEFIIKAKEIHGDYEYHRINYINSTIPIEIKCNEHGYFWQSPKNHINNKQGCPKCGGTKKLTIGEFTIKAREIHGDRYNYDRCLIYVNNRTKLEIKCNEHGYFWQTPNAHLLGKGCPQCGKIQAVSNTTKPFKEFLSKANQIHCNKYTYDEESYKNRKIKTKIMCPNHGLFWQTPSSHLREIGCPKCSTTISKMERKWLDHLKLPDDENHRQVNLLLVTGKKIKVDGYDPNNKTIYEFFGDYWHGNPITKKQSKIIMKNITYGMLYAKTIQRIEDIKKSGYNLVFIWESEWTKLLIS